jgi:hypothetical protein
MVRGRHSCKFSYARVATDGLEGYAGGQPCRVFRVRWEPGGQATQQLGTRPKDQHKVAG